MHHMVVLSQSPTATEIGVPNLMPSSADLCALSEHQRDHQERTVIAIQNCDVVIRQRFQNGPQQSCFASFLSRIWPNGHGHHRGGGQRQNGDRPSDRLAHSGLLSFLLWVLRLIAGRVGHGEREAINQLGVHPFPQPVFLGVGFHFFGHFTREFSQGGF